MNDAPIDRTHRRHIEVAILIAAREFDQQYEWTMHEGAALNEGVPQAVIDTIKHDLEPKGLSPPDRPPLLPLAPAAAQQRD